VTIHGRTDLHFTYVPSHISYMLLELLKNSMRATVETHGTDRMPPIKIVIADGEDNEDVSIFLLDFHVEKHGCCTPFRPVLSWEY
jgi:pyruvate dehydrogenase kinase 2/3/4